MTTRYSIRGAFWPAVCACVLLGGEVLEAQSQNARRAALAGTVYDTLNRPLAFTTVQALDTDRSAVTNDSGRFHLADLPAGPARFSIIRLGYHAITFETTLLPESTVVVAIRLRPVATLARVNVQARRLERLARTGFYDRARTGLGTHLSPERIDSLQHVTRPSQFLRDVRGIELRCGHGGCRVHTRMAPDCLWLFVNGGYRGTTQSSQGQMDELLGVMEVSAIEVYERPSIVPVEFQGPLQQKSGVLSPKTGCGAIVVWTKGRTGN